jgi:hypothetical protein
MSLARPRRGKATQLVGSTSVSGPTEDTAVEEPPSNEAESRQPRWWPIAGGAVVAAFVVSVVLSSRPASLPAAAPGVMPGMTMNAGPVALTMHDASNRVVRLPDGRPAVVVLAQGNGCAVCAAAVRAGRDALKQADDRAQLIVVFAEPEATSLAAFTRAVGTSPARYVMSRPNSSLVAALGVGVGGVVVYDVQGRAVSRPPANTQQIVAALRHATR